MPRGMIICQDQSQREFLRDLVELFLKEVGYFFASHEDADAACALPDSDREQIRVIFQSFVVRHPEGDQENDMKRACDEIRKLRESFAQARVIVELGGDLPGDAFEALDCGAFNVVSLGTDSRDVGEVISKAIGGEAAYPRLLPEHYLPKVRPCPNWGFMSMAFDLKDRSHKDFRFAVRPAVVERLGLQLERIDETPFTDGQTDLRARLQQGIDDRMVLVAQVSKLTLNTMYEIGYADAKKKPILWLHYKREDPNWLDVDSRGEATRNEGGWWKEIPAVLRGITTLHYATRTELAMKLYFGLGGPMDVRPRN